MLIILIVLFNSPDIVFISRVIIAETRNFLLTRDRAYNLMRVKVGTVGNVLKTDAILETNLITCFLFSNSRRKDNPCAFFVRRSFGGINLNMKRVRTPSVSFSTPLKTYLLLE